METEVSTNWTEFVIYNSVVYPFTTGIIFPGFTFCLFAVMKWLQTTISEILNAGETGTKAIPLCLHLVKGIQIPGILEIISCGIRILGFGIRNPSSTGKESGIQCLESKIHGVESRIQDTRQPPWIPLHGATCVTVFCYPSRSSSFWDDGWKVEKILKLSAWDLKLLKLSVNLHYNQVINLFWFRSRQKVLFPAFREEWEV